MLVFIVITGEYVRELRELPNDNVVWVLAHDGGWRTGWKTQVNYDNFPEHPVSLLNEYDSKGYTIIGHSITKNQHYSWTLYKNNTQI